MNDPGASTAIRILCSPVTAAELRQRMPQAGVCGTYTFVHPTPEAPQPDAEIGFVSRDITGASTKFDVKPDTAMYYEALLHAPHLQWVHIHSAGLDRPIYIDLQARGVTVTNSAGHNARSVAQMALGGVLALSRHLPRFMAAQREARWLPPFEQAPPRDLDGQVAVIVGWGAIGQHIAQVLQALAVRVRVARHDASRAAQGADITVAYDAVGTLLADADWLILACPISDATLRLIDAEALARLPAHAHLINVSRGTVVDEAALIDALTHGRLAGAYLDVFEQEPLPADSPLWRLDNVIATPHSSGHSSGNRERVLQMFLRELARREAAGLLRE
ncbi:D-2-hydroxyacid dehydrogenase [Schauerella aestuarii]|uniref:D-2-hydroxyacid dehydrogenase n=1 Tax=Schauerella aestuarii TaxID=2511204 RepID=UPI0013712907|nr:D-2-hydroxyacid dehydrogenase [Achromobacter aestuarii]MYZ42301.1 D-2-hydroxyacid dehydrogenase [Achromobacter aestuarii]